MGKLAYLGDHSSKEAVSARHSDLVSKLGIKEPRAKEIISEYSQMWRTLLWLLTLGLQIVKEASILRYHFPVK